MEMLNSLTDAQKAQMKPWADKWIANGLATGEADWDTFGRSVEECYRFANLEPPKVIIRCPSPLVAVTAGPIAHAVLERMGKKGSAVRSAVLSAVGSAVYSAVDSAVGSAVRLAMHSAVDSEVRSAVLSAVDSAVDSAVNSAVGSAVDSAVRLAMHSAVDSEVHSEVSSAMGSAVRLAVRSAVGSAVGSADVKGEWCKYRGGQFWAYWSAYESFLIEVCNAPVSDDIKARARAYRNAQKSVCWWWPHSHFVMASNRPVEILRDEQGQLHAEGKKAIHWPDGWGVHALHGVRVDPWLVETPVEKLDCRKILSLENAEQRMAGIRRVGITRMAELLGAKEKDALGDYALLHINLGTGDRPFLKMKNPSTGEYHVEGVHPECTTVEGALAWRNGMDEFVAPEVLT